VEVSYTKKATNVFQIVAINTMKIPPEINAIHVIPPVKDALGLQIIIVLNVLVKKIFKMVNV